MEKFKILNVMKLLAATLLFWCIVTASVAQSSSNTSQNYEIKEPDAKRATINIKVDQALINEYYQKVRAQGLQSADNLSSSGTQKFQEVSTSVLLDQYQNKVSKNAAINTLAGNIAKWFGIWFGGALFLLSLGLNYYKNVLKGKNTFDWGKVIRDGALYVLLVLYVPVMGGVSWLADGLPWMVKHVSQQAQQENVYVQFQILANKPEWGLTKTEISNVLTVAKQQSNGQDAYKNLAVLLAMMHKVKEADTQKITDDNSGFFAIGQTLKRLLNSFQNMPKNMVIGALILLASIAKFVIFVLLFAMDKILFVLGPLAILCSYFGIFKDKWVTWLSRWLTVKCTMATFVIIDAVLIMIQSTSTLENVYGHVWASPEFTVGFAVVSIVMYILSFWLTSAWIGSAEAGKFLSSTAGVVTTAMTAFAGAKALSALGGGAGGGGGGGAAGTAANLGGQVVGRDNPDNYNR